MVRQCYEQREQLQAAFKADKLLLVQLVDFLVVVKNRSLKILKNNCMSGSFKKRNGLVYGVKQLQGRFQMTRSNASSTNIAYNLAASKVWIKFLAISKPSRKLQAQPKNHARSCSERGTSHKRFTATFAITGDGKRLTPHLLFSKLKKKSKMSRAF
ncbi:Phosphoesterase [Phytophthora palmivora]|uniref:Phosphoesterase n=1 Tax=Phytophthora palmivora TaxID=4796 RepID=A0A2P4X3A9_9STRA|nr:Phosphoesterase [Phytophthora palmivora]